MTPEEWQRVRPILESALELEPASRASFLDGACADSFLRKEVESLLASHDQAGTRALDPGSPPGLDDEEEPQLRLPPGKRIGAYEILEEIGAGGMGEVHRAVRADDAYRKQVAIKLVRSGQDSGFVLNRFRNERQILAGLDHPNIARLLDGGSTEEGVPYFVMELVEGRRIDEYCDTHKVATTERLKLFLQVCSAVQYAHQHLIIHRDIKPGNILVSAEGVPKLLDFGIAKILESSDGGNQPEQTISLLRLLTPEYASPEQVKGEPITTASDVYSLGVVLYELLTSRTPYNVPTRTPHEISRAVCEAEPEKPSTVVRRTRSSADHREPRSPAAAALSEVREGSPEKLSKRLSGDLDNIVLMALRKEPQRRYASVEQFAQDIRRHLEHLPVAARKDTAAYRASKFIARHKPGVAATSLAAILLISALAVAVRQARIARAERARAEHRFNDVRALANSLMFEIHDGIRDLPGSIPVRELLVNKALRYLDSLSQEAGGDLSLERELAGAYERVGDLQWSTDYANLGDSAGALRSYRKALAIRESLASSVPADPALQGELTDEYLRLADTLESVGDFASSLDVLRKAVVTSERIAARTSDPKIRDRQGGSYYYLARMLSEMGDPAGALENFRRAAAIHEATTSTDPRQVMLLKTHLAGDYGGMAAAMMLTGDLTQAIEVLGKSVQIQGELSKSNPTNSRFREFQGNAYGLFGTIWEKQGDQARALEYYRQEHQIFKELVSADPANSLARMNLGFSDESIGELLVARGDTTRGLQSIREGLATFEAMAAGGAKDRYVSSGLAESYFALGMAYSALAANATGSVTVKIKGWQKARAWYQKSSDIWTEKRTRGALDSSEREKLEKVAKGISRCDAALAALAPPTR